VGDVDFLIFNMSNACATALVAPLLSILPPIRHVNLGLLPRSRDTWRDAVRLVNREGGGWIHAHENVGVVEMVERKEEIEGMFQGYVTEVDGESKEKRRKAKVEHVERVKMYAPGVVHCVFDVWIEGIEGERLVSLKTSAT
jgi:tRNA wybutosine-synthesizing protein 2